MMKNNTVNDCKILNLNTRLVNNIDIPFEVKRIYYLYDIQNKSIRGEHAHKDLYQVIIGLNEGLKIKIDDGQNVKTYNLDNPNQGLLIVPGIWRSLTEFSPKSICLVMASELYSENDYIRNYNEFLIFKK
ncbi:MAG: FdtA/QdtA family cupin domain-containing protein [Flavobacteriaceae bacterium]|nr:FdtA/QdtA family cupin domain-containing protein [Flavobacteriaceae bacterium]